MGFPVTIWARIETSIEGASDEKQAEWKSVVDTLNKCLYYMGELQSDNEATHTILTKNSKRYLELQVLNRKLKKELEHVRKLLT